MSAERGRDGEGSQPVRLWLWKEKCLRGEWRRYKATRRRERHAKTCEAQHVVISYTSPTARTCRYEETQHLLPIGSDNGRSMAMSDERSLGPRHAQAARYPPRDTSSPRISRCAHTMSRILHCAVSVIGNGTTPLILISRTARTVSRRK